VAVFRLRGALCAVADRCPHAGGSLADGVVDGDEVVCPLHGYRFDLKTGVCSTDPLLRVKTYPVVAGGDGFTVDA
jgi:nitrite reductase/ring-hydroxylating ferredoxin subunit